MAEGQSESPVRTRHPAGLNGTVPVIEGSTYQDYGIYGSIEFGCFDNGFIEGCFLSGFAWFGGQPGWCLTFGISQ
jgi:hypothetical protein